MKESVDLGERKPSKLAEANSAAEAAATARAEAAEDVCYASEDAGGNGIPKDEDQAQKWRAILLKAVTEHGVGSWETQVRWALTPWKVVLTRLIAGIARSARR